MIFYILGMASGFEALFLLLPILVSLIYGESVLSSYLISCGICALFCGVSTLRKPKKITLYTKEGLVAVALVWIWFSVFGAVPFMLTGEIPNFFDAFFEVSSGFTTTGASILTNVEALSRASLFWRSFTHWVGGMGILVFILAFIPNKGNGTIVHLMKAESPGPNVSKLVPKIRYTAAMLYAIYFGMTLIQIILLLISKMPLFDTLCITFGTAGTGGFSIKSDGCAGYTMLQQGIITTFMILFGVNFTFYFCILKKKIRQVSSMTEVLAYLAIIAASILAITFNISGGFSSLFQAFHHAAFQVGSIITTTGFSTVDFNQWPGFSRTILVTLMFVGACAGSTGGGIKVSRVIMMLKSVKRELNAYLHPKSVRTIKMEGKALDQGAISSVAVYCITFTLIFAVSFLLVALEGRDLTTNFTAVLTTMNNMGPGMADVGPSKNFGGLSILSKYVLMFDMLAGRLELFPMLVLFHPVLWKETWEGGKRRRRRLKRKKVS